MKMRRSAVLRRPAPFGFLAAVFVLSGVCGSALGAGRGPQEPPPFKDKLVLVLPVFNATGEKWEELKTRISNETAKAIGSDMAAIGYAVVPEADVLRLIKSANLDLNDEEVWKRDTFYDLGKGAGAEFVVFAVVTQATQRTRINLFSNVPEGDVTIKFWILNAKTRSPLLSAKSVNAKARSKSNLFGEAKGSECQVEAARRAAKAAIKEAFEPKKPLE